ncbi:hypothetical protein [uncultured Tateyamaria sp.]|uniref:hypothetical protein n=1 Tax=uncultured Tateyamaria sp. TaxID=455651 RepID=UPI00261847F1|nr:hypothetical protein [uncultured Tateyamaria sp.]
MQPQLTIDDLTISIIDTETDSAIATLTPGEAISEDLLAGKDVTLSVEVNDATLADEVGSMRLNLGDQTRLENVEPYALFGDSNGDFLTGEALSAGTFEFSFDVFSGARGQGETLLSETVSFSIEPDTDPDPTPVDPDPDPDPTPVDPDPIEGESIGTENDFAGVRLWVANDISEIDDAASTAALMLGAKNIADSDANITGSSETMILEGAFIDTDRGGARQWFDDVEKVASAASDAYDIPVYSPRSDIDVGAGEFALTRDMTASLETAFDNNEQMIVVSGGPTTFAGQVVSDWLDDAQGPDQIAKAQWLLEGGFSQVTHGGDNDGDDTLDIVRDPGRAFFNNSTSGAGQSVTNPSVQGFYEDLHDKAFDILMTGLDTSTLSSIEDSFVEDSLLISLENQNNNSSVRGPADGIAESIGDDLARDFALDYTKDARSGEIIDISDVGMLGILTEGGDQFSRADMFDFLA